MITEDYVSFKTAKLLKEKGFNEDSWFHYDAEGDIITRGYRLNNPEDIPAWTFQMVMKWLREVYNICIELHFHPNKKDWGWYFTLLVIDNIKKCFCGYGPYKTYSSYEEAAEAAIEYCLEKLL